MILEKMHRKRSELRAVVLDMRGINPKLSIYKRLEDKKKLIESELAALGAERLSTSPLGESKNTLTT